MSRTPRDPTTTFLRGAFEGWLADRHLFEELHLCDDDGQARVGLVDVAFDEDVLVGAVAKGVSEMGAAPRRAGRKAVKEIREQMVQGERTAEKATEKAKPKEDEDVTP